MCEITKINIIGLLELNVLALHSFLGALIHLVMPYAKQISAIYIITCTINNKHYIGKSVHYFHRIGQHKIALKENRHHNYHLQRAYNKYGVGNFIFDILEEHSREFLDVMEKYWINLLNTCNRKYGYNLSNPNGEGGFSSDDETKSKLSVQKSKRKTSEETKEKLRQINLGKSLSKEVFENLIECGKKYRTTEKYKQDMIKRKQRVSVPVIIYNYKLHTWKKYESLIDATNELNVVTSSIHGILNKSTKSIKSTYLAFSIDKFNPNIKYTKEKRKCKLPRICKRKQN